MPSKTQDKDSEYTIQDLQADIKRLADNLNLGVCVMTDKGLLKPK